MASRDEAPEMLAATVDGLLATSRGHWREVIVVDDGSRVPIDLAQPEVTILRNSSSLGCCPSRRLGCEAASGDILVITDPHMAFQPGWFEEMLGYAHGGGLLCSPWSEYEMAPTYSYGADYTWNQTPAGVGFDYRPRRPRARFATVPMVMGACYMLSRRSYQHLGGFCPFFGTWGLFEEDLSLRAWLSGLQVACVTRARVGHRSSFHSDGSRRSTWKMPEGQFEANNLILIRSNFQSDTAQFLEEYLHPWPAAVETILASCDLEGWRERVQSVRQISDSEFFARFGARLPRKDSKGRLSRSSRVPRKWLAQEQKATMQRLAGSNPESATTQEVFLPYRFVSCGVAVCLGGDAPALKALALECPYPDSGPPAPAAGEHSIEVLADGAGWRMLVDGKSSGKGGSDTSLVARFGWALSQLLSVNSELAFFQAGVVESQGSLLVVAGGPSTGVWTLVAELVHQGANLVAEQHLAVSSAGLVQPLVSRNSPLRFTPQPPLRAPIALVTYAPYRPGAVWRPKAVPASSVLGGLLGNPHLPKDKRAIAMTVVPALCAGAQFVRSPRDCPQQAARWLLRRLHTLQV